MTIDSRAFKALASILVIVWPLSIGPESNQDNPTMSGVVLWLSCVLDQQYCRPLNSSPTGRRQTSFHNGILVCAWLDLKMIGRDDRLFSAKLPSAAVERHGSHKSGPSDQLRRRNNLLQVRSSWCCDTASTFEWARYLERRCRMSRPILADSFSRLHMRRGANVRLPLRGDVRFPLLFLS
jgi:hypothetical protein